MCKYEYFNTFKQSMIGHEMGLKIYCLVYYCLALFLDNGYCAHVRVYLALKCNNVQI